MLIKESPLINFFIKWGYVFLLVKLLDMHNRKCDKAYKIAEGYRRCAVNAEFSDRKREYDRLYVKYAKITNHHSRAAVRISDILNTNRYVLNNNGYGIKCKYKLI